VSDLLSENLRAALLQAKHDAKTPFFLNLCKLFRCASTLTQRGYDNVFMLSGGLRVAALRFPESLLTDREEADRLQEGDIIVLDRQLQENLLKGTSRWGCMRTAQY
jgi:hypothetical protein